MSFIKRRKDYSDDTLTEFLKKNLHVLSSPNFKEDDIEGELECKSDYHANSMCDQIDILIKSLTKIKSELGGHPNSTPNVNVKTVESVSPNQDPTESDLIQPKQGTNYRNALSEAIKLTQTAQGANSTGNSMK